MLNVRGWEKRSSLPQNCIINNIEKEKEEIKQPQKLSRDEIRQLNVEKMKQRREALKAQQNNQSDNEINHNEMSEINDQE